MANLDKELLNYIAKATHSPLDAQIAFFNENVDKCPKEMISCVRGLAEATVSYLYFSAAKTNTIPGPYWCLIFKSNEFRVFKDQCDRNKRKGYPYPDDYQKMWEANQLLKAFVTDTFFFEANSVRILGNKVLHNNPDIAQMDIPREARKCLDSYNYLLSEVNRVVSANHVGTGTGSGSDANARAGNRAGHIDIVSGGSEHFSQTAVTEEKGSFSSFDVKKWFAGVQAELARERAKTQEDYDMEDDENY